MVLLKSERFPLILSLTSSLKSLIPFATLFIEATTPRPASTAMCLAAMSEGSCDTVDKEAKKS